MRVLLVEDDEILGDAVRAGLRLGGYAVDWLRDGQSALAALAAERYSAIVLDLGLPRRPGLDVLKQMRRAGNTAPVLILTARDTVADKVQGLDTGADDYLIKPFDLDELAARLRALVRRRTGHTSAALRHRDIEIDPGACHVTRSGQPVALSRREYAVLISLLGNRGRVLSRARLEQQLYGWDDDVQSNTVQVHIHHLRRKLGKSLIRTLRGVGYIIDR